MINSEYKSSMSRSCDENDAFEVLTRRKPSVEIVHDNGGYECLA